jgi:hypothetical protein
VSIIKLAENANETKKEKYVQRKHQTNKINMVGKINIKEILGQEPEIPEKKHR